MNTEYSKFGNPPIQIVESSSSGVKTEHRGRTFVILKKHLGRHAEQDLPDRLEMGAAFFRGARLSRRLVTICVVLSRVPHQEEDIPF